MPKPIDPRTRAQKIQARNEKVRQAMREKKEAHYQQLGERLIRLVTNTPGIKMSELATLMGYTDPHIFNVIKWVNERDAKENPDQPFPKIVRVGSARRSTYVTREEAERREKLKERMDQQKRQWQSPITISNLYEPALKQS